MIQNDPCTLLRFDPFELDPGTGELRKHGRRIRLQDQPARLLLLLASRPGDLVTRPEIQKELWGDGEFVEFEHAINTAVRKIREALDDEPEAPRWIETLPRKGYRFIGTVERIAVAGAELPASLPAPPPAEPEAAAGGSDGAAAHALPDAENTPRHEPVRAEGFALTRPRAYPLFLAIQAGYLLVYVLALHDLGELEAGLLLVGFTPIWVTLPMTVATAMCGIAVRLYLLSAVGLRHPDAGRKFKRLFPWLLLLDALWALSPLLAIHVIGAGPALAIAAGMAYLPFSQRTLMRSIDG